MSTYYLNVNMISRGKGQSAVASAAYRSGENLYSKLDMETKDYKTRSVQPDTFIEAPKHAPEWVYNREKLWNEVEWHENKSNSQLAREVRVALPIELDNDIQKKLLSEYVHENYVSRGMVADISIHRDVEHNPHAHIMLTVRPFNDNGEWGAKQKREYLKDENGDFIIKANGKKKHKRVDLTDWDKIATLVEWRKNYAEKVNQYYKDFDVNERVSHESYEKQGLDKIPKHRLNRTEYAIEKKEKDKAEKAGMLYIPKTHFAKLNQEIESNNYDIYRLNESIAYLNHNHETIKNIMYKELNNLRAKRSLSDEDWLSLRVVTKTVKEHVDISNAKDNLKRMHNWKQKMQRERQSIMSYGKTLEKAKIVYKDNPKDVMMYGFSASKFEVDYQSKHKEYKEKVKQYSTKINAYRELIKHSERAYDIQKKFTNEEFAFLYPDYAIKLGDNNKAMELKYSYVKKFENEGVLQREILELESGIGKYDDNYVIADELLKDWKENKNSLVILQRMKVKHQREYKAQYHGDWDSERVFDKSVHYSNTNEQIKSKENQKDIIENRMNDHLKILYPEMDDSILEQTPLRSKARLLELHVSEENTGQLSKDIRIVEKEIRFDLQKDNKQKDNDNLEQYNIVSSSSSSSAGDLFDMIVNNAQHNEGIKDGLKLKRQRDRKSNNKVRKQRMDIGDNEL
ncbi:MobQ family relaxase [Virgibacillus halodenitrificans]|uniref:MobQ family relaxase n=1 Tax=Virgibacillus halodenitrificans TaxID=1482 RepID=UPI0007619CB8